MRQSPLRAVPHQKLHGDVSIFWAEAAQNKNADLKTAESDQIHCALEKTRGKNREDRYFKSNKVHTSKRHKSGDDYSEK